MKKIIAILAIVILSSSFAADADAGRFGVKASVNLANSDFRAAPTTGYEAGLSWQINLPLWFAIQPDLLYSVNGATMEDVQSSVGRGYLKLPVNVQWGPRFANKNIRAFAQASPYVGYAVAKYEGTTWDDINRFTYGAGLGIGAQLWCFQVTAQYNWNLGALKNIKDTTIKDFDKSRINGATISVALIFGKKKNKE